MERGYLDHRRANCATLENILLEDSMQCNSQCRSTLRKIQFLHLDVPSDTTITGTNALPLSP